MVLSLLSASVVALPEPPPDTYLAGLTTQCQADAETLAATVDPARRPPKKPTDALPGTEAKVRVLADRWRRGEALKHPLDPEAEQFPKAEWPIAAVLPNGTPIQGNLSWTICEESKPTDDDDWAWGNPD